MKEKWKVLRKFSLKKREDKEENSVENGAYPFSGWGGASFQGFLLETSVKEIFTIYI